VTQALSHFAVPPAQTKPHLPLEQTWPLGHALPHVPQFAASVVVLTQAVPHSVVPPAQFTPHLPLEQT
jgi:hypothetical protein